MPRSQPSPAATSTSTLASLVIVVAALYFARDVLVPFALAVLFSFLLAPPVLWLQRHGLWRVSAVMLVAVLAAVMFGGVAWVVGDSFVDLVADLPKYKENIKEKVKSLRGNGESGALSQASETLEEIGEELSQGSTALENGVPASRRDTSPFAAISSGQPIPVKLIEPPASPLVLFSSWLGPVVGPLGTAGIVAVLVIFILIQREDLRDRLIRLMGEGQLNVTTQALDDAGQRVSRYLLMQSIVNGSYGLTVAIGLFAIQVPNAALWGLMAALLRFIPYIGPWIAASMPIAVSLAISNGWLQPLATIALFVVLELISNNVLEPWLYGSNTGVSTIAILVAAVFWAWLWGPMGLFLATPLTVCLVVIGRYVPQLGFLNVLLGDEPVLGPESRFYQRLLAFDQEEATEVVDDYLATHSLTELYDNVFVPALTLTEQDRHRGKLSAERESFIRGSLLEFIDDADDDSAAPHTSLAGSCVLCLPAKDEADDIAAQMLARLLRRQQVDAVSVSVKSLASEMIEEVAEHQATVVCISVQPPVAVMHARYLCKRLRARFPGLKIVVGLWGVRSDAKKLRDRLPANYADRVAVSLEAAVEQISQLRQLAKLAPDPAAEPATVGVGG